jgi:TRAP-type uncharacterized transport system fused permease subunit
LIPYMFIFGPAMVLIGSPGEIALAIVTGSIGCAALAGAVQGYFLWHATMVERGVLLIAALLLIKPGWVTDLIGLGLLGTIFAIQVIRKKKTA